MSVKFAAVTMLALGLSLNLCAQEEKAPKAPKGGLKALKALDKDSDGTLSKEEMSEGQAFASYDIDKDGALSKEEFAAAVAELEKKAADRKAKKK